MAMPCALRSLLRARPSAAARVHVRAASYRRGIASFTAAHQAEAASILSSAVDTDSAEFRENHRLMDDAMERLRDLHGRIAEGGPPAATEKHVQRGKMLVRE